MIIADFHTHTSFSTDSQTSPSQMIEQAITLGLKKYCITDHMDYRYPHGKEGNFTFDVKDYWKTLSELKEQYKSQIELLIGVELGLRNEPEMKEEVRAYYRSLTKEYPFDFVLGSTHVLWNFDPYIKEFWNQRTTTDGLTEYFHSIAHNAAYYDMFQIYGHLDYIIRYVLDEVKNYNVSDYQDLINEMLKAIIANGKGIECNTSGFKYQLGFPHPKQEILKRYRELGGELLTIGSDGHRPEHIAYDFTIARELLLELGFEYYTVYKEQKPTMLKL
jgi:histidinol-phosphatase (PHP family)